ncbi:DUF3703 domain-containing protein [Nocardia cyriacigeorgica]|uniref:DUF3703 domain-containing protein n=1 Tax=Nocardia cyriacigeorgica TaxID=135487 RepID=UPI00308EDDEE|nr:hypothetical protein FMUAM8_12930 [Nocardia cyriacigeorgica]
MPTIPPAARARYHDEMHAAKTTPNPEQRWAHLERAHILSQPDPWLHTRNHIAMFALAVGSVSDLVGRTVIGEAEAACLRGRDHRVGEVGAGGRRVAGDGRSGCPDRPGIGGKGPERRGLVGRSGWFAVADHENRPGGGAQR